MGKKKKQKQQVADYHLGLHVGVCHGPVDAVKRILVGEKEIYNGNITANDTLSIDLPELFGGAQKEGGLSGSIDLMLGGPTQQITSSLASRLGLTPGTAPGFRGLLSAFFRDGKGVAGFYWGTNSPQVRPSWFTVFRKSPGLNLAYQVIPVVVSVPATDENPASYYVENTSNPINIIYECLTDTDFGMGAASTLLDLSTFLSAQQVLHAESFGLSMIWSQSAAIESIVNEVLDHINATIFVNPSNGLLSIKLIRGDYDPDTLFVLNEDNSDITSFQRKLWGETINEINVTWTNPLNEQEETVTSQDLANISMQGGIVSDSRNYYGVRYAELAKRLANRDVRSASIPFATAEAVINRSAWKVVPGDVCKLNYPEEGVVNLPMRVMKVNYGKIGDSKIRLSLAEDIFGLIQPEYTAPPSTEWVAPSVSPQNFSQVKFFTAPWAILESEANDAGITGVEYPEVIGLIFAAQPNDDTSSFKVLLEEANSLGVLSYTQQAVLSPVPSSTLSSPLTWQAPTSSMAVTAVSLSEKPVAGGYAFIGDAATPEEQCELVYIEADLGAGSYTVRRGVLDTVPRAWPTGTRVWFFQDDYALSEGELRTADVPEKYKLLSNTSLGTLEESTATIRNVTYSDRPWLPSRPANVLVAGAADGQVNVAEPIANVAVSWSNRNRIAEPLPVLSWTAGSVTPEVGQTTTVRLLDAVSNATIIEHTGLVGTSFNIPIASFGQYPSVLVEVTAVRDGFESFQSQKIKVNFPARIGYGRAWGFNYGSPT
jgi:hypothetical protein